jgi:hypothetical protein
VLPPLSRREILTQFNQQLEDDDPTVAATLQALTRITIPSVHLVVLYEVDGALYLEPTGGERINLDRRPSLAEAQRLLGNSCSVHHWAALRHYAAQSPPSGWLESGLLRFSRLVRVDRRGRSVRGEFPLAVSRELGIVWV